MVDNGRIKALSEAFAKHDVVIAEVGRWCNLMDPDPENRRKNLQTVTDGLALAEAIGAGFSGFPWATSSASSRFMADLNVWSDTQTEMRHNT